MTEGKANNRIAFISFLQFVGVIFGHAMNSIPVPALLTDIKAWVYTWHMPLFFFVSAFLFSYKGGYDNGYKNVLVKRFWRLIVPYFIWNLLFILPKFLFTYSYDAPVELSLQYFVRIMLRPRDNILGHTWFLFALFEMFLIAIAMDKAKKHKQLWIPVTLVLAVINCFRIWNRWLALDDLMKNAVFFWCGLLIGTYSPDRIEEYLKDKRAVISTLFVTIGTTAVWVFNRDMEINALVLGFSVLILIMTCQIVTGIRWGPIEFISRNMFPIYILHWPVIMVLRLVLYERMGLPPLVCFAVNLVLGLAIPCAAAAVLRKIKVPWLQKVVGVIFGL